MFNDWKPGKSEPRIVTFDRYAFDLSKFAAGPQTIVYNTREKYIWELMWPAPDDPLYAAQARRVPVRTA